MNECNNIKLVSIIIPYYFNEYLDKTLLSIKKQDYSNIEIILVNDGSNDIDEKILKNYPNIRYYYKENEGLAKTRNFGINKANGEYIIFLDSDDDLCENSISKLVNYASDNNLEVVLAITYRKDITNNEEWIWKGRLYHSSYLLLDINNRLDIYDDTLSTNKLYHKDVFTKYHIYFEDILFEDKIFSAKIYSNVERLGVLKTRFYNWNIYGNNTSITTNNDIDNYKERIKAIKRQLDITLEYRKSKTIAYFLSDDLFTQIKYFRDYDEDKKKEVFAISRNFILEYNHYYSSKYFSYKKFIIIPLYKALINNDYKKFNKLSLRISKMYLNNGILSKLIRGLYHKH